ncbi:MAG: hypothetical protein GX823_06230, partial [Clostridiales bacterium]|nr:hypothetical protein [Clostridiales bacterium]
QKDKLYDFLEQGVYNVSEYRERMAAVAKKLDNAKKERDRLISESTRAARANMVVLRDRIISVLEVYKGSDPAGRNALLKSILIKIDYTKKKKTKPFEFCLELQYIFDYLQSA